MSSLKTRILVKTGIFTGDIGLAARLFNPNMRKVEIGRREVIKWGLYDVSAEPWLIIVSKHQDNTPNVYGYNSIITVASLSDRTAKRVAGDFEGAAETIYDVPVPRQLLRVMQGLRACFEVFLRHGPGAMDAWQFTPWQNWGLY